MTLSLDPSGYKKGARQASDSQKKLKDDIRSAEDQIAAIRLKSTKATAEQDKAQIAGLREITRQKRRALEDTKSAEQESIKRQKDQEEGFGKVKSAATALFAVLAGAASVKAFVTDIVSSDAALGRISANLGESAQTASAFGAVIKSLGGDAKEGVAALANLAGIRFAMQAKGDYSMAPVLSRLGVSPQDLNDLDQTLAKIAATAKTMPKAQFYQYAAAAGFSNGAINALELGDVELAKQIALAKERQHLTDDQIAKDQQLVQSFFNVLDAMKGLAREGWGVLLVAAGEFGKHIPVLIGALGALAIAFGVLNAAAIGAAIAQLAALAPIIAIVAAAALAGAAIGALIEWLTKAKSGIDFLSSAARLFGDILKGNWADAWLAVKRMAADVLDGIRNGIHNTIEAAKDLWYALTHGGQSRPGAASGQASASGGAAPAASSETGSLQGRRAAFAVDYLKSRGISDAAARGAVAGSIAESRLDPNAINSSSGAFGIGQWLGPRKAALLARFGPNPTFDQQLQFLASELLGGDRGGAAVVGAATPHDALNAYVTRFMRPAAGAETAGDLNRGRQALASLGVSPIDPGLASGAGSDVAAYADNSRSSSVRSDVQIHKVEVHVPPGSDGRQIGAGIVQGVRQEPFVAQANYGLA